MDCLWCASIFYTVMLWVARVTGVGRGLLPLCRVSKLLCTYVSKARELGHTRWVYRAVNWIDVDADSVAQKWTQSRQAHWNGVYLYCKPRRGRRGGNNGPTQCWIRTIYIDHIHIMHWALPGMWGKWPSLIKYYSQLWYNLCHWLWRNQAITIDIPIYGSWVCN